MKTLLLIFSSFLLSSCMHFIPIDHEGMHDSNEDQILEKEIVLGDVRAVAVFPPLRSGKEVQFTLKLFDPRTLAPISRARVFGHFDYVHRSDHASMMRAGHDSLHVKRRETNHDVSFHLELEESKLAGLYSFSSTPNQPGEYTIGFHIVAIGERKLEPEILVEANRITRDGTHEHSEGMNNVMTVGLIGAGIMGVMMLTMVFGRTWL